MKMVYEWIISFLALFIVDILYVVYMKKVQQDNAIMASVWATSIYLLNSVAIISYTSDNTILIPASIGAFMGTYVGMKIK
jgi:hypothetical protein